MTPSTVVDHMHDDTGFPYFPNMALKGTVCCLMRFDVDAVDAGLMFDAFDAAVDVT